MNPWDLRYAEKGLAYGEEPNDFLAAVAEKLLKPGGRVLSLGEGEGRNALFLASKGFQVTALDASWAGLSKARARAAERGLNLETALADLSETTLDEGAWDGILAIWCHLPAPLRRRVHRQAARALKPGGVFILETYTPGQLKLKTGGPRELDRLATLKDLKADLKGLEFLHALEGERLVLEGKYHHGPGAVAQVAARRPIA